MENQPFNPTQSGCLRVYVALRQPVPGASFWQRWFGPDIGHTLLKRAIQAGIRQAILLPATAGYLEGKAITFPFSESAPAGHPLCLELLDTSATLRHFVSQNQPLLTLTRAVFINLQTFDRLS